jgi:small subunit ribosomal protein S5
MSKNKNLSADDAIVESLVYVGRVTKVVKGGRKFSFSACVVVGNKAGFVGFAHGKAKEVAEARQKATMLARKKLKRVPLFQNRTLHQDVIGHAGAARVVLRKAPAGTGIIAGGAMRAVFECLGIKDIVAKALGSTNVYALLNATFDALEQLQSPRLIAEKRRLRVSEIYSKARDKKSQEIQEKEEAQEKEEENN